MRGSYNLRLRELGTLENLKFRAMEDRKRPPALRSSPYPKCVAHT